LKALFKQHRPANGGRDGWLGEFQWRRPPWDGVTLTTLGKNVGSNFVMNDVFS
jgi:hypothetical protein